MSRIGRKPIPVPDSVTVELAPGRVAVKGPKGELSQNLSVDMKVEQGDGAVTVQRPTDRGEQRRGERVARVGPVQPGDDDRAARFEDELSLVVHV